MVRAKPGRWAVSPASVDPQWRWAWRGLRRAYLFNEKTRASSSSADDDHFDVASRVITTRDRSRWSMGPYGPAIEIVSTGSQVDSLRETAPTPVSGSTPRTALMVVRIRTTASGGHFSIDPGDSGSTGQRWTLRQQSSILRIEIQGSGYNSSLAPAVGEWVVLGCVFDGSTLGDNRLFLNGDFEQASGGAAVNTNPAYQLKIGGYTSGNEGNHDIAGAWLWDRALSDDEIRRLTGDPFGPFRPEPIELEPAGQTVSVGQVAEAENALTVTVVKPVTVDVGTVSEAESALSVTPSQAQAVAIGAASESELALTVTPRLPVDVPVGAATETELALPVGIPRTIPVGTVIEIELGLVIAPIVLVPGKLRPITCATAAPTATCSTAAPTIACTIET